MSETTTERGEITYEELADMTMEEKNALPGRYHRPVFSGLQKPTAWICAVCWTEGVSSGWPCAGLAEPAKSIELAKTAGLEWSW